MTQSEPEFAEALKPAIAIAPMNRMGTPQEIADACLFLSSSKATFVQGAAMVSLELDSISSLHVLIGIL
jgi:NAD(P)-dependent dehydrogenase (short-subunit alcohol dehydrogenase family)